MWDTVKQQRLNDLRRREQEGALTEEDRQLLEQLFYELEQGEWATLRPSLERFREEQKRLQEECSRLRSQNVVLAVLAERYDDLLAQAKIQLTGLLSEHEVLKTEYERVTGQPLMTSRS